MLKALVRSAISAVAVVACSAAMAQDAPDPAAAAAGRYVIDPEHAYINFSYLHQGYSRPILRWRAWSGELDWDPENLDSSRVYVEIDAASVDSGVDRFDDHLKSPDFFDVENHPTITFRSTSVAVTGETTGSMTGDLTIKGETKPVTLDVTFNRAAAASNGGGHKIGFSAAGVVNRSDFGVDKYVPFVSDAVDLMIEVEFETAQE